MAMTQGIMSLNGHLKGQEANLDIVGIIAIYMSAESLATECHLVLDISNCSFCMVYASYEIRVPANAGL